MLDFEFENGKIIKYIGNDTDVVIPSEIDGEKVTSIGDEAFAWCEKITNITIPDGVTTLGLRVFDFCDALRTITIPSSVSKLSESSVSGARFEKIIVDKNNKFYSSENGVLFNKDKTVLIKYPQCSPNKCYVIPDSVKEIGESAFSSSHYLREIKMSNNIKSIGEYAFSWCTLLSKITLSNNITNIPDGTFYNCEFLESIEIPNSVKSIGDNAFQDCINLTSVIIYNGVKSIGENAFYDCRDVKLNIPDSVEEIGELAFYNCWNIKKAPNGANVGRDAFALYED